MADCLECGRPIPPRAPGVGGPQRKRCKGCYTGKGKPRAPGGDVGSAGHAYEYPTDLHLPHPAPPPEPPPPRPPRRRCAEDGCITLLSASNAGPWCRIHDIPGPWDGGAMSKDVLNERLRIERNA